ncbi:hypothetical protein DPMN_076891 [Dreissena polymorpha]|uniref:Uncharacterized protein n=1 Tax=Dreissena polymorpha TaxID=45954 RepID=A0A9D4BG57_DREPO|nr:hypothetical protein DPMN_076891 [Dreissena polymorpha]
MTYGCLSAPKRIGEWQVIEPLSASIQKCIRPSTNQQVVVEQKSTIISGVWSEMFEDLMTLHFDHTSISIESLTTFTSWVAPSNIMVNITTSDMNGKKIRRNDQLQTAPYLLQGAHIKRTVPQGKLEGGRQRGRNDDDDEEDDDDDDDDEQVCRYRLGIAVKDSRYERTACSTLKTTNANRNILTESEKNEASPKTDEESLSKHKAELKEALPQSEVRTICRSGQRHHTSIFINGRPISYLRLDEDMDGNSRELEDLGN